MRVKTSKQMMQSSNSVPFKCCKTKLFVNFVCVKRHSIYHKSCVSKFRKQIRFIKLNKIVCCEDDSSYIELDEKSILLEKTINDLTEDSEMKNKHIQKLKINNKLILDEALTREEELNELLEKRDRIIQDLKQHIHELEKNIAEKTKTTNSITTQTKRSVNKTVSTSTEFLVPEVTAIVQEHLSPNSEKITEKIEIGFEKQTNVSSKVSKNSVRDNETILSKIRKRQILLLCDDSGTGIHWDLREKIDRTSYEITVIRKPGALLHQVMCNIENLIKEFTLEDFVIVMGGSNDILSKNSVPSFSKLCNKLKQCTNTNVMFTSIIYSSTKYDINKRIFKYNQKLNDFLHRFNGLVKGRVEYIELNNSKYSLPSTSSICNLITKSIFAKTIAAKNLKFVDVSSDIVVSLDTTQLQIHSTPSSPQTLKDNEDVFLYPHLSNVSLIII